MTMLENFMLRVVEDQPKRRLPISSSSIFLICLDKFRMKTLLSVFSSPSSILPFMSSFIRFNGVVAGFSVACDQLQPTVSALIALGILKLSMYSDYIYKMSKFDLPLRQCSFSCSEVWWIYWWNKNVLHSKSVAFGSWHIEWFIFCYYFQSTRFLSIPRLLIVVDLRHRLKP